jgi:hypothetical protein
MNGLKKQMYLLGAIALLGFSSSAIANPVGVASIANCTPSGGVTVTATTVTWLPDAGGGRGCIGTGLPTSISTVGGPYTGGLGTIENLPPGSPGTFIVLDGGLLDFSLTGFGTVTTTDGICSQTVDLAANHSCVTSALSPFKLIGTDTGGTAVTLTTLGILTDTEIGGGSSPYSGLFTTQFTQGSASIAHTIDTSGAVSNTYSATLTTVPEPATAAFLGLGVVLLGIGRKGYGKR